MGDSTRPKSKGIPSWQLQGASESPELSERLPDKPAEQSTPEPRASLIEKASKFLEDKEIREASTQRKTYFLQTKGLTDEEISDLLQEKERVIETEVSKAAEKDTRDTTQLSTPAASPQPADADIMDDYIDSEAPAAQKQDGPPIITYPEFLLHSQKPPPLITTGRLLTTLYLASGAAATMYGLSNYVIEPMVESLSSARHSFFETASTNIHKLNEKLESTVSRVPDGIQDAEDVDGENGSVSSDTARFFSRTIATQTSPRLSRSTSSTSLSEKAVPSAVSHHTSHISRIHELLSDLKDEEAKELDPIKDNVQSLTEYLNNLPILGRTGRTEMNEGNIGKDTSNNGVAKVKAEIKGVKGALLSARNFPAGITSR